MRRAHLTLQICQTFVSKLSTFVEGRNHDDVRNGIRMDIDKERALIDQHEQRIEVGSDRVDIIDAAKMRAEQAEEKFEALKANLLGILINQDSAKNLLTLQEELRRVQAFTSFFAKFNLFFYDKNEENNFNFIENDQFDFLAGRSCFVNNSLYVMLSGCPIQVTKYSHV